MFVCNKEGKRKEDDSLEPKKRERAETRTNCGVKFGIHRKPITYGKYRVYQLCLEHNHSLHSSDTVHMMASQRRISEIQAKEIELADASGIQVKQSHEFMSKRAGGIECTGFIELDHRIFLRTRRQHDLMYGDAGSILSYFSQKTKENPFFFYDLQLDSEEQITNIFWADARMRVDYGLFGDVISFDTTYSTNKESRPFGIFVGLNHHRSTVILGAAILYDETAASFEWLFETFLNCHSQKNPRTIFTDQDAAMAKAIRNVIQDTYHGLCTFHIMLNGIRHLGNLTKDGSSFLAHFQECMYAYSDEEEFESAWETLLAKYSVQDNKWLTSIYKLKEKWASCYMKDVYSLGMRSTQLSESCNAELKRHLKSSFSIISFFRTFEDIVRSKNYKNLKLEYNSREKLPLVSNHFSPFALQMCNIYIPSIFKLFQTEITTASAYVATRHDEKIGKYVLKSFIDGDEAIVSFPLDTEDILCSCKKFESWEFLCRHAIRVLDLCFKFNIPSKYILSRWTKDVITHQVEDNCGYNIQEDVHMDVLKRYRHLCPKLVRLEDYAAQSKEGYEFILSQINGLMKAVQIKGEEHVSQVPLCNSAP
ncbi:hypothetical protein QQ045_018597 [Rhodiola kirilowii]